MIEIHNLSFSYGSESVLKDVSFSAKPGETTVIIGANGAGKTTLLKCIAGLQKSCGDILLHGENGREISREKLSKTLGFLDQNNICEASLSVFEVILLGRLQTLSFRVNRQDVDSVTAVMNLLNIGQFSDRNISELSGGQRQLVFIAQTLVKNPEILILDEPTSALDLHHQFKLLEFLKKITAESSYTTLITLHHLDIAAKYADHIVVINDGCVYQEGTPNEVFTEKMLRDVYKVDAEVYTDSQGKKHVIPVGFIEE